MSNSPPHPGIALRWLAAPVVLVVFYIAGTAILRPYFPSRRQKEMSVSGGEPEAPPSDSQLGGEVVGELKEPPPLRIGPLATVVQAAWKGGPLPATTDKRLAEPNAGVYVELRERGTLRGAAWGAGTGSLAQEIASTVAAARRAGGPEARAADTAVLCTAWAWQPLALAGKAQPFGNIHRGIWGLELRRGDIIERITPLEMTERNADYATLIASFEKRFAGETAQQPISARTFRCEEPLIPLAPNAPAGPEPVVLERGARYIAPAQVTAERTAASTVALGAWLAREGIPTADPVTAWATTLALVRLASQRHDQRLIDQATATIRANLAATYAEENGKGLIGEGPQATGVVSLEAVSLAALAIIQHPARAEFATVERALVATTFSLQEASGALRPFHRGTSGDSDPALADAASGRALLLWATLYRDRPDQDLRERFLRSFRHYRARRRVLPTAPFAATHSLAIAQLWSASPDAELAAYLFELNDWLITLQDWSSARYPDVRGRFHVESQKRLLGPPGAASSGACLGAIAEAFRVARSTNDHTRMHLYRRALLRGARFVMQLQFDAPAMFYVRDATRPQVEGALKHNVYDSTVHADDAAANLDALARILAAFGPDDWLELWSL